MQVAVARRFLPPITSSSPNNYPLASWISLKAPCIFVFASD